MFVRVLGVRRLLQVLQFGVSEVSRFKCQRISLGLIFQLEVWVSNDSKIYLTECVFSGQVFQGFRGLDVSFFRSNLC